MTTMDVVEGDDRINLGLSKQEALVFFDWLGRFNAIERDEFYVHGAEQQVMFDLEATLEKLLAEPFKENYVDLVRDAQESVFPSGSS